MKGKPEDVILKILRFIQRGLVFAGLGLSMHPLAVFADTFGSLDLDTVDGSGMAGLVGGSPVLTSTVWNPAALGFDASQAAFVAYGDYLFTVKTFALGYRGHLGRVGIGAFTTHLTSGDLAHTTGNDPAGEIGRTFTYGETTIAVGGGLRVLRGIALGGCIKTTGVEIDDYRARATVLDLGVMVNLGQFMRTGSGTWDLNVAVVRRSMALAVSRDAVDPRTSLEIGIACLQSDGVAVGVSWLGKSHGRAEVRAGIRVKASPDFRFMLGYRRRIGRFSDASQDFPWHRGLNGGFGVRFGECWLGYDFEDAAPLDSIHRFSIKFEPSPSHSS